MQLKKIRKIKNQKIKTPSRLTYPLEYNISEIRFWVKNKLVDVQKIKNSELKGVQF